MPSLYNLVGYRLPIGHTSAPKSIGRRTELIYLGLGFFYLLTTISPKSISKTLEIDKGFAIVLRYQLLCYYKGTQLISVEICQLPRKKRKSPMFLLSR
jgi:hypothetical protein